MRWLCLIFTLVSLCTQAGDLQTLQRDGHLQLHTRVETPGGIVPGQRVTLALEVAVDTWFGGGTRIRLPEVPGLVILQTEQFANNASERREGRSWVVQRWHLDVYPQRAGQFNIPPLSLQLQVNNGTGNTVSGTIDAPGTSLDVVLPPDLADLDAWVAAPDYTARQTFDKDPSALQVGDAIERSIELEASEVLAMMLPAISANEQDGLRAYPLPPALENRNNRGVSTASRIQRISYVAERPGQYTLPALDFHWWDTTSNSLKLVSLPATAIVVSGAAEATEATPWPWRAWLTLCLTGLGIAGLGYALWRLLSRLQPRLISGFAHLHSGVRKLRRLFRPALAEQLNPGSNAED
jgi:hypothetical protein